MYGDRYLYLGRQERDLCGRSVRVETTEKTLKFDPGSLHAHIHAAVHT